MGFETVVFSTTKAKEAEAKAFGASEFYLLEELEKIERPVCFLNSIHSCFSPLGIYGGWGRRGFLSEAKDDGSLT